jgi:hypothetical protein
MPKTGIAMTKSTNIASTLNVSPIEARDIAKDAYIYGFPVVDSYRIQCAYFVDRSNPEFKAAVGGESAASRAA